MSLPIREEPGARRIRVVLTYRVLFHWRTPVFQRLAKIPDFDFLALHGSDFSGTKAVNSKNPGDFRHRELWTLKPPLHSNGEAMAMPICPSLPLRLAQARPDVIVCEGGSNLLNNLLVFAYALPTRTPIVWWTLGQLRSRGERNLLQRAFDRVVLWMERHSAALLGYSSLALEYFARSGLPKRKQFCAVNCIDTDRAIAGIEPARARAAALRASLRLGGCRVLLFVGAMTPAKRLEDLIAAYARLRPRHPELRLLLVGDGPHRAALEKFARSIGAEDSLFAGHVVDDAPAYFLLGDLFVLPGLGGLAISEAMTYGLPVVASEADGCELDLIQPGQNGELVPSGDVAALEACLEGYVANPERMRASGERSRAIIDSRFNIHSYMENVEAAIRFAASSAERRSASRER